MSFPAEAYTQGERFQLEKRRLFATAWLPFCAVGQVAVPGSFVSHAIGGWPLFAIRGADGVVRGFRNQCRHQGMPVVEKPVGQCDALRCRYHGWVYDLSGAFASAPPVTAPEDPLAPMHHLDELPVAEGDGMIHLRGRGANRASPPAFALGDALYSDTVSTDLNANWKTVIEALLPDPRWHFVWPIAVTGEFGAARIVRQIVPRSFNRTRLVDLLFVPPTLKQAGTRDAVDNEAQRLKAAAEVLQAARAAGDCAPDHPAVQQFRDQLAAVLFPLPSGERAG
jgi:phenylpropionate dioxygenase-like ring-hydroxylating dioxygenase large terminal subunit